MNRLDFSTLAAVANFSPFHFHRLFTAWMGATLVDYMRRRRLEIAALRLVTQLRLPVIQVALSVGFGSTEAFARAFKVHFKSTPTAYRKESVSMRDQSNRMETNGLHGKSRDRISLDDPDITDASKLRYDAAVEVPDDFAGTRDYHKTVLPGGKYVVGRFKGNETAIGEAWSWLLRDWLPDSGMQLDSRPFFEHYPIDATYDRKTGEFEAEICIPMTPL